MKVKYVLSEEDVKKVITKYIDNIDDGQSEVKLLVEVDEQLKPIFKGCEVIVECLDVV